MPPKSEAKEKRKRSQHSSWVITRNISDAEIKDGIQLEAPVFDESWMYGMKYVFEIGGQKQRLHWHAAIWGEDKTWAFMNALFQGADVQVMRGSWSQAKNYCTIGKGKTPPDTTGVTGTCKWFGRDPKPGDRSDLKIAAKEFLDHGWDAVDDVTIIKYHKGLEKLRQVRKKPKREEKEVTWVWGDSGCGKSQTIDDMYPNLYRVPGDGKWFDGYMGDEVVVFEDYDGTPTLAMLLRLLDKYKEQVPVKGGFTAWTPQKIFITSHYHPSHYFPSERYPEVHRRINTITHKWRENGKVKESHHGNLHESWNMDDPSEVEEMKKVKLTMDQDFFKANLDARIAADTLQREKPIISFDGSFLEKLKAAKK